VRLISIRDFFHLGLPTWDTNEGRKREREAIHEAIAEVTKKHETRKLLDLFQEKGLVAAPIHSIPEVINYPPIRDTLLETETPEGKKVRLPPPSVEREYLETVGRRLPYAPGYGRDTDRVLEDGGFSREEIEQLREAKIIK